MKPSFALNLSHDGLSLLRRAKGGWQVFGSVALDDPNLPEKLGYLRKTATELAGGQLAAKLVIPNSEILYRTVMAAGENDIERAHAVRAALVGATPYPVDDLAFDWADAGNGMVYVAAVARGTLAEAENFATEHRFNPVSFVAIPADGDFVGEPFFGETDLCRSILPEGESVESDPGPIVVLGDHDPETAPETLTGLPEGDAAQPDEPATPEIADQAPPPDDIQVDGVDEADAINADSVFSTSRSGVGPEDGVVVGLESIPARFALYADKSQRKDQTDTIPEPSHTKALITPKAVTAPDVAKDELPAGFVEDQTDAPAKKPGAPRPLIAPSKTPPERLVLDNRTPAKTIYDVRNAEAQRDRPKFVGMSLTFGLVAAVLLAVLVSSFIFDRPIPASRLWQGFSNSDELATGPLGTPQIVSTSIEPLVQPSVETGTSAGLLSPQPDAPLSETELAESDLGQLPQGEITFEEATLIQASTGVWVLAPIPPVGLEAEELDDFYVASIDRAVLSLDAVALPGVAHTLNDVRLGEMASPAPPGTLFDLDERGFVRATRDGVISPNGVRVTLGAPSITPTLRPRTAEPAETAAVAENALPNRRALARPTGLIEANERAQLGGLSRNELARRRPLARPASPQESSPAQNQPPTELAVLNSRMPALRPVNFANTVEIARAAAQAKAVQAAVASAGVTASPSASPTVSAAVAPAIVPRIPSNASVAREATIESAIHLNRVNLIGVYGSSSDRRALVRLKSGRYVKVQIGDRLDGGKVAAIKGGQLQYIKSGRMVTLDIAS